MLHIAISSDDAAILRELLDAKMAELRKEIWHTDHQDFRRLLKTRAAVVERVVAQIDAAAARPVEQ